MQWVSESDKLKFWKDFLELKRKPIGVTIKRASKLKSIIWNDQKNFWFYVDRKPEEMSLIILEHLILNKIIKYRRRK